MNLISKLLSIADLSRNAGDKSTQPILSKYPTTKFGAKDRSFNADWYQKYPWLEYSVRHDAGFCYVCRHFKIGASTGRIDPAFVRNGFRNWKKATGKDGLLKKHAESLNHRAAMQVWQHLVSTSSFETYLKKRSN